MDELIDTVTLQFKVKAEYKNIIFKDFKNGIIHNAYKKRKRIKLKKSKSKERMEKKENKMLPSFKVEFTGKYGDYSLYYSHYYFDRDDYIQVTVKHNAIKNKDDEQICEDVRTLLESIGIDMKLLEKDKLNRIDYKHDYECEYNPIEEKKAIMSVCSKVRDDFFGVHKEALEEGIGIKYNPQNSYNELILYDKDQERKDKLKKDKRTSHTLLELKEYENVFRIELRLKRKRLYLNKNSVLKIDDTLKNYYNEGVSDECFSRYVEPIFYTETFWRVDYAILAIQNDRRLTEKEAEKLCKLVVDINKKGFTRAKEEYNYCDDTFEDHIKLLRSIDINPITFDENIDIKFLLNFTTKESCRDYSLYENLYKTVKNAKKDIWKN